MEQLKRQNLKLLDEVDGVRAKLRARTANFETDRDAWRERERFLERKLAAYESNAGKRQTVGSVGRSTAEMESLTDQTSETFEKREQKLAELQGDVAVMNGAIETLTTRLQECKQELVRFEIKQGMWKDRERFLELKMRDYKKQMNTVFGDSMERESGEAVVKESSAEPEITIDRQSGRVPEQIVGLQKVIESLKQELEMSKSKEHDFEREREMFSVCQMAQTTKIKLLESLLAELREKARFQSKTAEKPCREMEVQTDVTMQTFEVMEAEVKDVQNEFNNSTHKLKSVRLKFKKERAEWREQRLDLEERATVSESKLKAAEESLAETEKALEKARQESSLEQEKSNQTESDELREETSKEHLVMGRKVIVLEEDKESQEKMMALFKEESTPDCSFNDLVRKWEKASTSGTAATTETQSELGADNSQAKQQLTSNKSKEHDFEKEKERFSKREKELEMKIQLLESQVTELRDKARGDCPQRETADKPCREMEVQTDVTMQTIDEREHEWEEEFKYLVLRLQNEQLNINKERAEWRKQRQDLEERVTVSESEKSNQKECDELKEERWKEHSAKYHAMEQKVIVLEQERHSLEKTVALLKENSTQKDEAARRQQDKASPSEAPAGDLDSIILQQLDNMEIPRVRALVHRLHSHCSQRADALEEERDRLSEIAQMLSGKLEEHETNEVRLEAESEKFQRRAVKAETQLGKAQDDVVRMEKAFREERDMFQEMEKQLHDLQKEKTTEQMKQKEDDALHWISKLTETKERLETALEEARKKNKEHMAKEEHWTRAREKLLSQIELMRVTKDVNQSKKERKGFFSRVFRRRD